MRELKQEERPLIAHLFKGVEDSMVISYFQGYMGDGWADTLPEPTVALIVSGEYSFVAGDCASPAARELAGHIFDYAEGDETTVIFGESEPLWETVMLAAGHYSPEAVPRFKIAQRDYVFDERLLQSFIDGLPKGYQMLPFDARLYRQALSEEWSKEFCETFGSAGDYLKKGFGYGIVQGGRLVSGASTMTVYDGGTETQVATSPDYRKRGLALCCAAAFVLECQRRGIRPCWDAANPASLHIALMLGYEYSGEYTTILMRRTPRRP